MRRMPGPIESRRRLTAPPQAARERRRKPAATIASKSEIRIMANLSRGRSGHPIIRTGCPLLRVEPVGPSAAGAISLCSERARADSVSYLRTNVRNLLYLYVGEIRDLEDRIE
jgi:hypothetical protein